MGRIRKKCREQDCNNFGVSSGIKGGSKWYRSVCGTHRKERKTFYREMESPPVQRKDTDGKFEDFIEEQLKQKPHLREKLRKAKEELDEDR